MKINKKLTPYNYSPKADTGRIKYIVIHYFGSLATAKNLASYWAGKYVGASAHYAVGHDGDIYQCVEDGDIAWHCGAKSYRHPECRNSNSIGIEMAVCKQNKKTMNATDRDWYFKQETVDAAVGLVRDLMQKYGIPEDHVLRHYDVTGKTCPNPFVYNGTDHNWESFQAAISGTVPPTEDRFTAIAGSSRATPEQMAKYLYSVNPGAACFALRRAGLFYQEGQLENIRGDVAFAQSLVETGNYTFTGSAVQPGQYNYGGFGVTDRGMAGLSFGSEELGVRAFIQHCKAYADRNPLKMECVDPRFGYVERGCATYVEYLGIQENPMGKGWAAGKGYGGKILSVLERILATEVSKEDMELLLQLAQDPPGTGQDHGGGLEAASGDLYRIRREWEDAGSQLGAYRNLDSARASCPAGYKVFDMLGATVFDPDPTVGPFSPYRIRIHNCTALNIRKEPKARGKITGTISSPNKEYTVVEEVGGWGRLQSGAGWIKLSYTKKV